MRIELKGDWYFESLSTNEAHLHRVKKRVTKVKTPFQTAEIVDSLSYGRCLFLDGLIQSAELDEFIYHEALIHPALFLHKNPQKIFVAGGGEGAPLREILKHPSIEQVVMVEIDKDVVKLAKKYLKGWHQGAFNHPKVSLYFDDARKFLEDNKVLYDCLFLDLCDPGEEGPAGNLFTLEFYELVKSRIHREGMVVIQAGSANLNMLEGFSSIFNTLRRVFPVVFPYQADIPSFVGPWTFFLTGHNLSKSVLKGKTVEKKYSERRLSGNLRFYDPSVHQSLFALPAYFRKLLEGGKLISDKKPLVVPRIK